MRRVRGGAVPRRELRIRSRSEHEITVGGLCPPAPGFFSPFSGFVDGFVSLLVSVFVSFVSFVSPSLLLAGRLSVLYQPEPLNTIADGTMRRRGFLPQLGHFPSGSSWNDWTALKTCPQ